MSKKRSKSTSQTVPLVVPQDMRIKVRSLAAKSRLSDADIMRMAIDRGLGQVEKMFEPQESVAA